GYNWNFTATRITSEMNWGYKCLEFGSMGVGMGASVPSLLSKGAQKLFNSEFASFAINQTLLKTKNLFKWGGNTARQAATQVTASTTEKAARVAQQTFTKVERSPLPPFQLNRFHSSAQQLSEVGQHNIRTLRGWARSKGWERYQNNGGPEKWGVFNNA